MKVRAGGTRRLVALVLMGLLAAAIGVGTTPSPASAWTDVDGDGLDDGTEDALASRFFPWVWFDSGEDCTAPAFAGNPGTALARVRPHPSDPAKIAVQYVILYRQDCGDLFGITSHVGDVEPFSLTLAPNPACPYGYGAFSLKTISHEGTSSEHIDQRLLGNACNWGRLAGGPPQWARIYSSENKHGNYASEESCDSSGPFGSENCSETYTLPFNVYNVGEDHARRIDELSAYQFPGEYAWSPVRFRGGTFSGDGTGPVRDKWVQDRLLAVGTDPPPSTRCRQPAHAWYLTPGMDQNITQGQSLLVTAAGVQPDSVAIFQFFLDGSYVAYYQTRWANSNCVINQEYMYMGLSPGTYQVLAYYEEPVSIGGSVTRTTWLPNLTVHPGSGGGGGGGGGEGDPDPCGGFPCPELPIET